MAACKAALNGLSTFVPAAAAGACGRGLGLARSSPLATRSDVDVDVVVGAGKAATSSNGDRERDVSAALDDQVVVVFQTSSIVPRFTPTIPSRNASSNIVDESNGSDAV